MKRNRKHAKFIHAWAEGEEVQYFDSYIGEWILIGDSHCFCDDNDYRFKPNMIKVGEHEFPEPMRVAPTSWYWVPTITTITSAIKFEPKGDEWEREMLKRGLCHETKAEAEAHAKALIALTEIKE